MKEEAWSKDFDQASFIYLPHFFHSRVWHILSGSFIAKHKLKAASSVKSSLKTLIERELVYETDNGYIIYDRFMGEWLREQGF